MSRYFEKKCQNNSDNHPTMLEISGICEKFHFSFHFLFSFSFIQFHCFISPRVDCFTQTSPSVEVDAARAERMEKLPRASLRDRVVSWVVAAVEAWVGRFGRRGTEPNELFRSEFGQNSWNQKKTTKSYFIEVACDQKYKTGPQFFQNSGIFARKFKNFGNFQHFLKYRRNSDKISSKSEQKSMKRIQQ